VGGHNDAIAKAGDDPAPAGGHRLQPLPRNRFHARSEAEEALLVHAGHGGEVRVGGAGAEAGDGDGCVGELGARRLGEGDHIGLAGGDERESRGAVIEASGWVALVSPPPRPAPLKKGAGN
jgi:hypothetical protein